MSDYHTPVMLSESISSLVSNPDGTYIDATFGGGGHTAELLSRLNDGGHVIAFDRDGEALGNAPRDKRLTLVHNNFRYIENYWEVFRKDSRDKPGNDGGKVSKDGGKVGNDEGKIGKAKGVDGILADLGVSSHQFDTAERGFSFRFEDAPLDMRMNGGHGKTAADFVNSCTAEELEKVLRVYGEVDGAGRMAGLIIKARPVTTTGDLDRAIAPMLPKNAEHKVLAKVYQALRIEVNGEMRSLEKFLEGAERILSPGGRLVVITYHSLEDRMVKHFIKGSSLRSVGKFILPSESEIASNTRARSAKLRVAEKREED
ncbi:MAG: 16S rRNA (cytosine(1402)-N(4))-methyltransferase RsmH [Bacteroidales bacterium]|nr:16S rRNA (cytosine(1402)-N(4))-methyltransferase RsmH [Bacteroidales bacterium]